jgi:3-hydroxyacyl-CoA dehydrogenase
VPGFYVNRCLGPVLVETSALVKEGVPLEKLDEAMKKFGKKTFASTESHCHGRLGIF